jgi:hypothetical protein
MVIVTMVFLLFVSSPRRVGGPGIGGVHESIENTMKSFSSGPSAIQPLATHNETLGACFLLTLDKFVTYEF